VTEERTATAERPGWSVEGFEAFWSDPNPALVPAALAEDVIGHWAGRDEPVRGKDDYTSCIVALMEALPDLGLEVGEHARTEEFFFVRWIMRATGEHGPFELTGIDRIRLRDGLVAENMIVFDTAAFEARSGKSVPWA
jgi:SnoaL-like polyketide cyclase